MLKPEEILAQEQNSSLPHFGLEDLNAFVDVLKKVGGADYERVCILIKLNQREVFFHAGVNTTNENNLWVTKKENTVDTFDHSSLLKKALYLDNPDQFYEESGFSPKDFAIVGGGLPILVDNTGVVGSLIVSGLTDEEDHELGYNALMEYKKQL